MRVYAPSAFVPGMTATKPATLRVLTNPLPNGAKIVALAVNQSYPGGATRSAVPSPTATPWPSPSPAPGSVTASFNPVNLNGTGAANQGMTTIAQTGFSGTFGMSNSCSGIATVSAPTAGSSEVETIVGLNSGTCSATFTGASGQNVVVTINVTVTNIGIDAKNKKH